MALPAAYYPSYYFFTWCFLQLWWPYFTMGMAVVRLHSENVAKHHSLQLETYAQLELALGLLLLRSAKPDIALWTLEGFIETDTLTQYKVGIRMNQSSLAANSMVRHALGNLNKTGPLPPGIACCILLRYTVRTLGRWLTASNALNCIGGVQPLDSSAQDMANPIRSDKFEVWWHE